MRGFLRASLSLSVVAALGIAGSSEASVVALQPLGRLDPELIASVARRIERSFAVRVEVLPPRTLPRTAFYPARRRYRGERLVAWLEANKPARATKVLGLMSRDLSVRKGRIQDWGVMGLAGLSGPAGVVSTHRLGRSGGSSARLARRAGQVTVHELGHTFGLRHCPSPRCIMNDARGGIGPVDASSGNFCNRCRRYLRERGVFP